MLISNNNLKSILSTFKDNIYTEISAFNTGIFECDIDKYTKMADIPYEFERASAVAIDNNIYLLGSGSSNYIYNYKYDTTTDTYTQNTNIPYNFYNGSVVSASNIIYLLGGYNSLNYNYKYRLPITANCTIKKTNHSIYTQSESYTSTAASIVEIGNEYYTEYNGNNIINNTYPISSTGTTKMYIKSGAILNDKSVTVDTEGWQDINLLNYM